MFAALILFCPLTLETTRQGEPTIDTVIAAWEKRADATKSVRFKVTETYKKQQRGPSPTPRADLTFMPGYDEGTITYYFELRPKGLYAEYVWLCYPGNGKLTRVRYVVSIADDAVTVLSQLDDQSKPADAFIRNRSESGTWPQHEPGVRPLMWALRGSIPKGADFTHTIADYNLRNKTATVDGVTRRLMEMHNSGKVKQIWLAPAQGWLPVQWDSEYSDSEHSTNITNRKHAVLGWIPWKYSTISMMKNGQFICSSEFVVEELEPLNDWWSDDVRKVVIPPGTKIIRE